MCAAMGYLAAAAGSKGNKAATLAWGDVEMADESKVAACMQSLPRMCAAGASELSAAHRTSFPLWHLQLRSGFNLCCYGFGSKRETLREFAGQQLTDGPVVEINGYMAGCKLSKALDEIIGEVFGHAGLRSMAAKVHFICSSVRAARATAGLHDASDPSEDAAGRAARERDERLTLATAEHDEDEEDDVGGARGEGEEEEGAGGGASAVYKPDVRQTRGMVEGTSRSGARGGHTDLYLLVHNIDAPALRDAATQQALAELAAAPGVHIVASTDHVNAASLWDPVLRARFNWAWADVTTFARYAAESPYACGAGVFAGEDQTKSALVVLRALNANSRGIVALLIKEQLAGASGIAGVTFARLHERARELFLASTEMALKNHLAELRDHKILRERSAAKAGGAKLLYIPLPVDALNGVLAELKASGIRQGIL